MPTKTKTIRAVNDELRRTLTTGTAFLTSGIAALGAEAVARIVQTIAVYDDFCHANDPYEEHDFGSFEAEGHMIFFKIDYFDKAGAFHSPDPSDSRSHNGSSRSCWPKNTEVESELVLLAAHPKAFPLFPRARSAVLFRRRCKDLPNSYVPPYRVMVFHLLRWLCPTPALTVTLLIGADKLCIGQHMTLHCSLDLRFRRAS